MAMNPWDDLLASGKNKIKNDVHSWFITERIESMYSLDEFNLVSDYSWAGGASSARPSIRTMLWVRIRDKTDNNLF